MATESGAMGLNLMQLFVENFDVSVIYDLGWFAARDWMLAITGILTALAIGIRSMEEQVNLASGGRSGYQKMVVTTLVIAVAIGAYFVLAWIIIQFFNALYGMLSSGDNVRAMTTQLDSITQGILSKDYNFKLSDIIDSAYAALATFAYAITFCILVFMILMMRIAHALIVSFCLLWGAVALPMSITTGFKMLKSWGVVCIMALIWPITESFFMYLISGAFNQMLTQSALGVDDIEQWNMGTLFFYLGAFSIINMILIATVASAPFVALNIANGSGNITGMIGSFAGAAIGAGYMASHSMTEKVNKGGTQAWRKGKQLLGFGEKDNNRGGNSASESLPTPSLGLSNSGVGYNNANLSMNSGLQGSTAPDNGAAIENAHNYSPQNPAPGNYASGNSSNDATPKPTTAPQPTPTAEHSSVPVEPASDPEPAPAVDTEAQGKAKQARRGAIINRNRLKHT